jgi:hypothetical protein
MTSGTSITSWPGVLSTPHPRRRTSSAMMSTSRIAGTWLMVLRPGASSAAAMSLSTLFFAPVTRTSPANRAPPITRMRSTGAA